MKQASFMNDVLARSNFPSLVSSSPVVGIRFAVVRYFIAAHCLPRTGLLGSSPDRRKRHKRWSFLTTQMTYGNS